jgi:hypothetical protein
MSINTAVNNALNNVKEQANNPIFKTIDLCPPDAISISSYTTNNCICTKGTGTTQQIAAGGSYTYAGYVNTGTPTATKYTYCSTKPN